MCGSQRTRAPRVNSKPHIWPLQSHLLQCMKYSTKITWNIPAQLANEWISEIISVLSVKIFCIKIKSQIYFWFFLRLWFVSFNSIVEFITLVESVCKLSAHTLFHSYSQSIYFELTVLALSLEWGVFFKSLWKIHSSVWIMWAWKRHLTFCAQE